MITCRNLLLVFLMLLALPFTGTAQTMTPDTHHAMNQSSLASSTVASEMATSAHDCCAQDPAASVCENGQECKTISLFQLAFGKVTVPALSPRPSVSRPGQVPTRAPDIVWHPPRS